MALRFVRRFSSTHLRSKPIDINRIRQDPGPFTENAVLRKFGADAEKPTIIAQLSDRRKELLRELRKRKNGTGATLSRGSGRGNGEEGIEGRSDGELRKEEQALLTQMSDLAWDVPNLTAPETPIGDEPRYVFFALRLDAYPSVETLTPVPSTASLLNIPTSHSWTSYRLMTALGMITFA